MFYKKKIDRIFFITRYIYKLLTACRMLSHVCTEKRTWRYGSLNCATRSSSRTVFPGPEPPVHSTLSRGPIEAVFLPRSLS